MRKLAIGLSLAVMFLAGCSDIADWAEAHPPDLYGTQAAQDIEDAKEKAITAKRPNVMERVDGPADSWVIRKFETEFSDGTRVGCVAARTISCVKLKGAL